MLGLVVIGFSAIVHQGVELGHGDFFSDGGQVQIESGRLQRAVSQILLDLPQVDTGFQKMRGVAVSQRMSRDAPFGPVELIDHFLDAVLDGGGVHRLIGGGGLLVIASFARKDPGGIAM